jgi:hypothetical protein
VAWKFVEVPEGWERRKDPTTGRVSQRTSTRV